MYIYYMSLEISDIFLCLLLFQSFIYSLKAYILVLISVIKVWDLQKDFPQINHQHGLKDEYINKALALRTANPGLIPDAICAFKFPQSDPWM